MFIVYFHRIPSRSYGSIGEGKYWYEYHQFCVQEGIKRLYFIYFIRRWNHKYDPICGYRIYILYGRYDIFYEVCRS
jgi:hypothetical protein